MLGKTEVGKKRRRQRMRWLDGITNAVDMKLGKLWEMLKGRDAVQGHKESDTLW